MTGRRMNLLALLLTSMVSIVGLAWSSYRLYFAVSCVVRLGLAAALLRKHQQSQRSRAVAGYDPCPRCGSLAVERAADEIHYVPSPAGDIVRHFVRCSDCGNDFESRVGGGF